MKSGFIIWEDNYSSVLDVLKQLLGIDVLVGILVGFLCDDVLLSNVELGYFQFIGVIVEIDGEIVILLLRLFLDMGIEDFWDKMIECLKLVVQFVFEGKVDVVLMYFEVVGQIVCDVLKVVIEVGDCLILLFEKIIKKCREMKFFISGDKLLCVCGFLFRVIQYVVRKE